MKRRLIAGKGNVWVWVIGGFLLFCLCAGVGGTFFFVRSVPQLMGTGFEQVSCSMTMAVTHKAMAAYAVENEGRFPDADTWMDDLEPYYTRLRDSVTTEFNSGTQEMPDWIGESMTLEMRSGGEPWGCDFGQGSTGLAFNEELSGMAVEDIDTLATTLIVFEIDEPARNAAGSFANEGTPPEVFGQQREWFRMMADGSVEMGGENTNSPWQTGNAEMDFSLDLETALGRPLEEGEVDPFLR